MDDTASTSPSAKSRNYRVLLIPSALVIAGAGFIVGRALESVVNTGFDVTNGLTIVVVPLLMVVASGVLGQWMNGKPGKV